MEKYDDIDPINIGTGHVKSISEVGTEIKELIGYKGQLIYDSTRPDGMPEKVLDSSVISAMGWSPKYPFDEAIRLTYEWYERTLAA